jgi:hypothetical protein
VSVEARLAEAVADWRAGRYYEAHEALEELADLLEDDDRDFAIALALVHIAAALHKHVHRVSAEAVPGKLSRALLELETAPAAWRGLDLGRLRREVAAFLAGAAALPALVDAAP